MKLRSLALSAAFCLTAACGSDGDSSSGLGEGLDTGKSVSEFTPAETETLCENLESESAKLEKNVLNPIGCSLIGFLAGGFSPSPVSACQDARRACLDESSPDDSEGGGTCEIPSTCTATVAELEACFAAAEKLPRSSTIPFLLALRSLIPMRLPRSMKTKKWRRQPPVRLWSKNAQISRSAWAMTLSTWIWDWTKTFSRRPPGCRRPLRPLFWWLRRFSFLEHC